MRVISGIAKSIQLLTIDGDATRPTTDRIKETLFNMIQFDIANCTFLDLFSGSGAIGIEALSRGAKQAVFVDKSPKAIKCIKENIKRTGFKEQSKILNTDALTSIYELDNLRRQFDIIFIDPPYNQYLERDILKEISSSKLIHDKSIIIVEAAIKTDFDYLDGISLSIFKEKKYKTNKHVFINRI